MERLHLSKAKVCANTWQILGISRTYLPFTEYLLSYAFCKSYMYKIYEHLQTLTVIFTLLQFVRLSTIQI